MYGPTGPAGPGGSGRLLLGGLELPDDDGQVLHVEVNEVARLALPPPEVNVRSGVHRGVYSGFNGGRRHTGVLACM